MNAEKKLYALSFTYIIITERCEMLPTVMGLKLKLALRLKRYVKLYSPKSVLRVRNTRKITYNLGY